jgi:hypothetical protein
MCTGIFLWKLPDTFIDTVKDIVQALASFGHFMKIELSTDLVQSSLFTTELLTDKYNGSYR